MQQHWRALTTGAVLATSVVLAGCGSAGNDSMATSSTGSAAASATAEAPPGDYGAPVNPTLSNPTSVATDAPVTAAPTSADAGGTLAAVAVQITYSGWDAASSSVQVGAYAAGIAEDDGTCTLTMTMGAATLSATSAAGADASSTSCADLSIPGDQLSSGTWRTLVSYSSSDSRGASDPVDVVVP